MSNSKKTYSIPLIVFSYTVARDISTNFLPYTMKDLFFVSLFFCFFVLINLCIFVICQCSSQALFG